MKRLLISLFTLCMWAFSLHAQNDEFNPVNPGDPQPFYMLQVQVSPAAGGKVDLTRTMLTEGQKISLRISPNKDFKLQQWVCGDSVLSTDNYLYFTMPARNVVITAQMIYQPEEPEVFNPESPSDPTGQGEIIKRHLVTVYSSPSVGGYTNQSAFYMQEGEQRNLYAYPYAGYEFTGWYIDDKLESRSNPVNLTMGNKSITLTARFRFNPISPIDPNANLFNAATGDLIIDRFTSGHLSDVVYSLIDYSNFDKVKSLTVIGEMTSSDYGVIGYFNNLVVLDLSRTTGYTEVPSWAFDNMSLLTRVILPATLETIGYEAFYACSSLSEIVLYAPAPPTAQQTANDLFEDVPEGLVVRVPAASVALYQTSSLWNSFIILPMDVQSLNVTLPEDKVALYENMFLELLDTKSGQMRRYVITQRNRYAFTTVFEGTTYQLTLRNAQNKVFGQEMIAFSGNDTTVSFASLKQPVDIFVQVLDTAGNDVTEHTTIMWTDSEGKYLSKGNLLSGQVEGDMVFYQINLDETIGVLYQQPDSAFRVIADKNDRMTVNELQLLSQKIIKGNVIDSISNQPISGASLVISQRVNGKYVKNYNVMSANNGAFSLQLVDAPFDIVVFAAEYKHKEIKSYNWSDNCQIKMTEISGATISYNFHFTPSVEDGEKELVQNWYNNYNNVDFELFNITKNKDIKNFEIQYPRIRLLDNVEDGDEVRIYVSSRTNDFMPIQNICAITNQSAAVTFEITEMGRIVSSYTESENNVVVGCLYNANGKLVKTLDYTNKSLTISNLADGNYTLVTIGKNDLFNSVYDIRDFASIGLTEGSDFVSSQIAIESGKICKIDILNVPIVNAIEHTYTGVNTSFKASKSSVIIGNYITFTGRLDFYAEYATQVSNVLLFMDIPDGCTFVENTVIVGNNLCNYTLNGNQVVVPLKSFPERVRFCAIPTVSGTYSPSAYVQFDINGKTIKQSVGTANFTAQTLSISVPENVANPKIIVSGLVPGKADIEIFDNGTLIGQTTSSASGQWRVECNLANAYNLSTHAIYAKAKNENMELLSETKNCFYNIGANSVRTVTMSHYNAYARKNLEVIFNLENGTTYPSTYDYYTDAEFSFTVDFLNNDTNIVSDVYVYAFDYNGNATKIKAMYDSNSDRWIAKRMFTSKDAPVNVSVEYNSRAGDLKIDARQISDVLSDLMEDFSQYNMFMNSLTQLFDGQMTENDIQTFEQLTGITLNTYETDSLTTTEESALMASMTDEELEAYLDRMYEKYVREDDSIFNELNIIEDNLTFRQTDTITFDDGITYELRTCEGITSEQLLNLNYREYPLTDGTSVYFFSSDTIISFVNFGQNTYLVIHIPDNPEKSMLPIRNLSSEDFWNAVDKFKESYDFVRSTIDDVYETLNIKAGVPVRTIEKIEKDLAARLKVTENYLNNSKKPGNVAKWSLEVQKLQKALAKAKLAKKIAAAICKRLVQCLPIIDYLSILRDCYTTSDDIIRTYQSIPDPCKDDKANANVCKASCVSLEIALGSKTIADVLGNFSADVEIVGGAITSVATAGTSLAATAWGLVQKVVVKLGGTLIDLGMDYALDKVKDDILKLECNKQDDDDDEEDCDKPGYPPCPCKGGCGDSGSGGSGGSGGTYNPKTPPTSINWDPAGFVYEGVEDNRVEGVKATVYHKETRENVFGERVEEEIMWDAAEFDQENPLYTDENGFYQWFVPQGLWQVRFEKEGYEPTQSEWLPVPPPQLEVNIPIVQLRQPEVINAIAHKDAIDITFDKYMLPSLLNTDNIYVMADNQVIAGSVVLLNEQHPYNDNTTSYASKIRFVPESEFTAKEITLTVSNRVHSYADVPMAQTFQQTFDVDGVGVVEQAALPVPSIESGSEVLLGTELSITCPTEGATIRYTLDGTTPDCLNGLVYKTPILLYGQQQITIQAVACADGYNQSDVAQWTYTFVEVKDDLQTAEQTSQQPTKVLQNGHIYILMPGGQKYTVIGTQVE